MGEKEGPEDNNQASSQKSDRQPLSTAETARLRLARMQALTKITQLGIAFVTVLYVTALLILDIGGSTPGFFSTEFILNAVPGLIVGVAAFTISPLVLQNAYSLANIRDNLGASYQTNQKLAIDNSGSANEHEVQEDATVSNIDCSRLYTLFHQRMIQDGRRLSALSLRNLTFGIVFSAISLFFIAFPLFSDAQPSDSVEWLTKYYLPRFGVGIILQFVGFFFLRLYVSNEYDIKFNKNEITNFDAKFLSYLIAASSGDKTLIAPVIASLSATERNFILKKGERVFSQVGDEKYNDVVSMLDALSDTVARLAGRGRSSAGEGGTKKASSEQKKSDAK